MKKFFVDTNVVLDYLMDRKPFSKQAIALFESAELNQTQLCLSSLTYSQIYYLIKKQKNHKDTMRILKTLSRIAPPIDTPAESVLKTLAARFHDFEDGMQYFSCMKQVKVKGLITRNTKDYPRSHVPILTPDQALKIIHL